MMQFFCCQCKYISFVRHAKHKSLMRIFKSVETEGISNFLVKWCTCTDKGACVWPVKARFQTCAFGSDVYFANKDKPNNTKKQNNLTCAQFNLTLMKMPLTSDRDLVGQQSLVFLSFVFSRSFKTNKPFCQWQMV